MKSLPATPIGALKEFAEQKYSNFSNQHPQDFLRSKRLLNVSCTFNLLPVSQWVSMFWRNQYVIKSHKRIALECKRPCGGEVSCWGLSWV